MSIPLKLLVLVKDFQAIKSTWGPPDVPTQSPEASPRHYQWVCLWWSSKAQDVWESSGGCILQAGPIVGIRP